MTISAQGKAQRESYDPALDYRSTGRATYMKRLGWSPNTVTNRVIHVINQHPLDWRFHAEDFAHLGKPGTIYHVFARLAKKGWIKALKPGLYVRADLSATREGKGQASPGGISAETDSKRKKGESSPSVESGA